MADAPKGPFTRWRTADYGWLYEDFATLKEAIEADANGGPIVVTRPVNWQVFEVLPDEGESNPDG